jgi:hypothetical protein
MANPEHKWIVNKISCLTLIFFLLILLSFMILLGGASVVYPFPKPQTIDFVPTDDPITNPLMGWAPWATLKQSQQPFTLVYVDLTWRDLEPQPGVFDFDSFETKNQFPRWRAEGKRVVFRFVCDQPGETAHTDIPDWLYTAINGSGDVYNNDYGKGFSPDYSNPTFIQEHQKVINALSARYGNDDFFAYIELGSLGHWGEWHTNYESGVRRMPPENIRDQYVMQYKEAFPNKYLLMRRPFSIAERLNLGLYNDVTGNLEGTNEWLDWIQNGGEYDQTNEAHALVPMPDGWQLAPIGGEQPPTLSDEDAYITNLDQTIWLLKKSHTTFIGPGGPDDKSGGVIQKGIDRVIATIGYRLYVKQIQMPSQVSVGKYINISIDRKSVV